MSDFLPILNLNFGETPVLSVEDEAFFYEKALDALSKAFNEVEISFVSDGFIYHAEKLFHQAGRLNLRLAFGSIYEPEQVSELARLLKKVSFIQSEIKIFAPVYRDEIKEILDANKDFNFKYIPGFFTNADLMKHQSFIEEHDSVKIFPFKADSAKSLYNKLCKPYPELVKHLYISRILFASKALVEKYNIFENVKKDDNGCEFVEAQNKDHVFIVKKPLDYQKIRSQFLFNPKVKIFFDFEETLSDEEVIKLAADKKVFLTGVKQSDLSENILEQNSIIIAKSVFSNSLRDFLSGALKVDDLGTSFEEELRGQTPKII
jgi:2-keto-3-deoxy-6-phosphogluconate aldolase